MHGPLCKHQKHLREYIGKQKVTLYDPTIPSPFCTPQVEYVVATPRVNPEIRSTAVQGAIQQLGWESRFPSLSTQTPSTPVSQTRSLHQTKVLRN